MNEEFKEAHLRALYKLLGHEGHYSRVGSVDYSQKVIKNGREVHLYEEELVKGEQEVIDYARKWNGSRNVFIGRGIRNQNGSVFSSRVLSIDIDPIRPKEVAATEEQHANAIRAANRILSIYPGGYSSSSGNGCLIVYHLGNFVDGLSDYYRREAILFKELQEKVNEYNVKIDSTYYSEAVIKAIGTFSTKGEASLRRCSKWINYPLQPYTVSNRLLERLNNIKPEESATKTQVNVQSILSSFNGDRSTADYHLVHYLKQSGVSAADALIALQSNPLGRQTDKKDWARLLSKIYGPESTKVSTETKTSYFDALFSAGREFNSVSTGFQSLDSLLGPFPSGEFVVFAGRSGFGKTTFACTVSEHLRSQGKRVLYFSTEMAAKYIYAKLLAIQSNIPFKRIAENDVSENEMLLLKDLDNKMNPDQVIIDDTDRPTVEQIVNSIVMKKPDLVIIDHINHIHDDWLELSNYMKALKEKVKNEDTCFLLLAQLKEPPRSLNSETGEAQSLRSDLQSGNKLLNIISRLILMVNPFAPKTKYQPVLFDVQKDRFGGPGGSVKLYCDLEVSKYVEKE